MQNNKRLKEPTKIDFIIIKYTKRLIKMAMFTTANNFKVFIHVLISVVWL